MKLYRRWLVICLALAAVAQAQGKRWVREFDESVNVLVLQNPSGRTEVEVVEGKTIYATVEAVAGAAFDEAVMVSEETAPGVRTIRIPEGSTLHLRVWVPSRVVLSIQSASGEITVRGATSRLLAQSQSGNVMLHLPARLDLDIKLDTKKGQVVRTGEWAEEGKQAEKARPLIRVKSETGTLFLMPLASGTATPIPAEPEGAPLVRPLGAAGNRRIIRPDRAPANPPITLTTRSAAAARSAAAKSSDGHVRVNSDLVVLNAFVVDAKNAGAQALQKEDFAIFDNGAQQQISIFEPVHKALDLFILLDLSGSTHSKFDVVKKAVKRFIDVLGPEDRIAIAAFTSRYMLISDFSSDKNLLKKRLDDTKNRRGGTEFYKAMWNTLDLMMANDSPRRAIVVMTDGVDNSLQGANSSSPVGFEELLERVRSEGVSVYPVYLNTEFQMVVKEGSGDSLQYKEAREQLQAIAEACGTTMFRADRFQDLEGAYERVAEELRNLYTLGFYPSERGNEGDWHELKVTVHRADATVRARKGYFVR